MDQKSNSALTTAQSAPHSAPNNLLTLRGLAQAIGVDAGQLTKEAKRPGFPRHQTEQGVLYSALEVQAWRQSNVRTKSRRPVAAEPPQNLAKPRPASGTASPPPPRVDPQGHPEDADLLAVLKSGTASALEISRAAMHIAARRLARAHVGHMLGPNDFDGLKKALQELRTAEADYITLEKTRHQLIAREDVRVIVGECCMRLLRVLGALENSLATEVSIWLADPKMAAMGADERARVVRTYVVTKTREARMQEAADVEKLINECEADESPDA